MASDAETLIGSVVARRRGAEPISEVGIRRWLEAHEISSPLYGDANAARSAGHDGPIAPWSMLLTVAMPPYWESGNPPLEGNVLPPFAWGDVPVPGEELMSTQIEIEFYAPLRVGDWITSTYRLLAITPKRTRVGSGYFIEFEVTFTDQSDTAVAVERTTVYRYTPDIRGAPASPSHRGEAPADSFTVPMSERPTSPAMARVGDALGSSTLHLSLQRLIMVAAANRDFAPAHVSNEAARAGGAPAAYADVMFIFAMFERLAMEWGGPQARIKQFGPLHIRDFVVCGHDVTASGVVSGVRHVTSLSGEGWTEVSTEVGLSQDDGRTPVVGAMILQVPAAA